MKLTASNSNNQPPEVSPDDSWSDAEDPAEGQIPRQTVLSSRRSLVDQSTPVSRTEVGLRIESTLARSAAPNSSSRIGVQEINREVIRLEQAVDAPARIERHFIFHEKQGVDTRKSLMRKSQDWGMSRRFPIRWILGMALNVGLVVIACLMLLPAINAPNTPPADPNMGLLTVVDEEKIGGMEKLVRLLTRQLSEGAGDGSEIRGSLSKAEFYSATWPEEDYQSYRLATPNEEASIWCYSRRGETVKKSISSLFNSGEITGEAQSVQKVTLSLVGGPAKALPNHWLIEEMLHINWGTH